MSRAASVEIEQAADRRWYEFRKRSVDQEFDQVLGLKKIRVHRGIKLLPSGEREVVFEYDSFGYRAGPVEFSGYPMLRTWVGTTTLEDISADPEWLTSSESQQKQPSSPSLATNTNHG